MSLHTTAVLVVLSVPLVVAALILVVGTDGAALGGLPLFAACVIGTFVIQWLVFIHAHARQTERFFDLTGSVTYILVALLAATFAANADPRSLLLAVLVVIWAVRLGSFLFRRVSRDGHDSRFKRILPDFRVHLMTWTLQGIWVSMTILCALIAITSQNKIPLDAWAVTGAAIWLLGFLLEVIADAQKTKFRADPANRDKFITTGLWSISRHPNYLGEILLWIGVAVIAYPVLQGVQLLALLSPLFVIVQMTKISGVDMLERRNDKTWRDDPDYHAYKARTAKLVPFIVSSR